MRVHVISDMEGVAGIVKWEQTTGGEPLYEEGRKLYTDEINVAVRGAKSAGATEIVVMDCHGAGKGWTFNSLIHEDLDPACEYVVQNEWTLDTSYLCPARRVRHERVRLHADLTMLARLSQALTRARNVPLLPSGIHSTS